MLFLSNQNWGQSWKIVREVKVEAFEEVGRPDTPLRLGSMMILRLANSPI